MSTKIQLSGKNDFFFRYTHGICSKDNLGLNQKDIRAGSYHLDLCNMESGKFNAKAKRVVREQYWKILKSQAETMN